MVRGRDLFHATSVHVLLQRLLDLPTPAYHHHRLILDETGRKLSKSDGDTALRALREAGKTPADIRRMLGLSFAVRRTLSNKSLTLPSTGSAWALWNSRIAASVFGPSFPSTPPTS